MTVCSAPARVSRCWKLVQHGEGLGKCLLHDAGCSRWRGGAILSLSDESDETRLNTPHVRDRSTVPMTTSPAARPGSPPSACLSAVLAALEQTNTSAHGQRRVALRLRQTALPRHRHGRSPASEAACRCKYGMARGNEGRVTSLLCQMPSLQLICTTSQRITSRHLPSELICP